MDMKILELATKLTDKAMGGDASATNWIGHEDQVIAFLTAASQTLDALYTERPLTGASRR
jgi:hypothetical protein